MRLEKDHICYMENTLEGFKDAHSEASIAAD